MVGGDTSDEYMLSGCKHRQYKALLAPLALPQTCNHPHQLPSISLTSLFGHFIG